MSKNIIISLNDKELAYVGGGWCMNCFCSNDHSREDNIGSWADLSSCLDHCHSHRCEDGNWGTKAHC